MPILSSKQKASETTLRIAEDLWHVLTMWVRTTRDRAGNPSSAKVETLRILQDEGPAPIAALAERRSVKHQSMRLLVEQLAAEEMVRKNVDSTDRRSRIVSITDKGRSVVMQEQRFRAQWVAQLLQGCSTKELAQVMGAMGTLERLFDNAPRSALDKP